VPRAVCAHAEVSLAPAADWDVLRLAQVRAPVDRPEQALLVELRVRERNGQQLRDVRAVAIGAWFKPRRAIT
jgi:hypothetical protein